MVKNYSKKQYTESKYRRTKSWQSNPEYDKFLACSSMSDLVFLKQEREKDLNYFRQHNDLRDPNSFGEYKELQQTYKMICEELENRHKTISSESNREDDYFFINGEIPIDYSIEDDEDFVDYSTCDESIKYDWKEWCKKKGLDTSEENNI